MHPARAPALRGLAQARRLRRAPVEALGHLAQASSRSVERFPSWKKCSSAQGTFSAG